MTVWEHRLTPGLVSALVTAIEFVHRAKRNSFHLQRDLAGLSKSAYNNFQKLRFHALVAKIEDKPGYWLITARGGQFLRGKIKVPATVKTFRNRVIEHGKALVSIRKFRNVIPYFETKNEFVESAAPKMPRARSKPEGNMQTRLI
jgi:uncharacterized protein YaaR (DUF327 family)